jgi:hypothetical protein
MAIYRHRTVRIGYSARFHRCGFGQWQHGNEYDGLHNRTINFYSTGSANFDDRNIVGTPDEQAVPTLVCNTTSGLHSGQYFNAACFQAPLQEMTANNPSLGTYRLPYIHGPRYEAR